MAYSNADTFPWWRSADGSVGSGKQNKQPSTSKKDGSTTEVSSTTSPSTSTKTGSKREDSYDFPIIGSKKSSSNNAQQGQSCPTCGSSANTGVNFIADAVDKVMDSVVNIMVEVDASNLFSKKSLVCSGSGFVVSADGTILTNAHVVGDLVGGGGKMTITASDGTQFEGYIYSLDPLSDLAVVKVKGDPHEAERKWTPVTFGENSDLRPGDWVVAIGSPFGLQNTVTAGVVSSRRRRNTEIGQTRNIDSHIDYIQTDCVVHSGSSGGPLVNLDGEVIGINTTRAESEGISFAIRADNAMDIIKQLVHSGRVVRPWLGLRMVSLTAHVWQQLKMRGPAEYLPHTRKGVLITSVFPDSPASNGGCIEGDVVVAVNHQPVKTTQEILKIIGHNVGEPVYFTVSRKVALDIDWDGRVGRYEPEERVLRITPEELDVFLHSDRIEFLS
ncbi:hypothetical protein HK102_007616 [Quaeritorhiza haematococci]|nr:hypothetical protein HK102_007616 [Quaeritorhiza haematococci]